MIGDLQQPAKAWLADHLDNFATQLRRGNDPACLITLPGGVEVEIRLVTLPGMFERQTQLMTENHA